MERKSYIGCRFGKLVVLEKLVKEIKGKKRTYYKCICDCGNLKEVRADMLTSGNTKSCGCLLKEYYTKEKRTHGDTHTRLYSIYNNMKNRCYNESYPSFHRYGGRGIKVCKEWLLDYESFKRWALLSGYSDTLTLDRKNNDGDYSPDNCRWATRKEQSRNTSSTHLVEYKGETKSLVEWCELLDMPYKNVNYVLNNGLRDIEDIFQSYKGKGFTGTRYDR